MKVLVANYNVCSVATMIMLTLIHCNMVHSVLGDFAPHGKILTSAVDAMATTATNTLDAEDISHGIKDILGNKIKKDALDYEKSNQRFLRTRKEIELQSSVSYYLNQNGGAVRGGDGLTPATAFKSSRDAIKALSPGDTLYIMGELTNPSYDDTYTFTDISDPHLWHQENTLRIHDLHGSPENPITITSYGPTNPAILKGDGANILRITQSSHLIIENLEIYGEVERIPLSTAKAVQFVYREVEDGPINYRVDPTLTDEEIEAITDLPLIGSVIRPSYTDTRGLYMSNCEYVTIRNNNIHHLPGTGLRVAYGEYVDVIENKVHNCSRKSYSGTHGLVVTQTLDALPVSSEVMSTYNEDYRATVIGNTVYDNYNEIYSWVGTKTFLTPRIDEGKGISLQRNQAFTKTETSRILVANNVAYGNGFSGIHSNDGDNIDFFSNTAYMNSYTNSVTYADVEQRGNNIGISMSNGVGCRIANNIAVIDSSWGGYPISITSDMVDDIVIANNLVYGIGSQPLSRDGDEIAVSTATIEKDPLFTDEASFDFSVQKESSPAVNAGDPDYSLPVDYYSQPRDSLSPTIGAIE